MYLSLIFAGVLACVSQICETNIVDHQKIEPRTATSVCKGKASWTLIPNLEDCHKFYLCINDIAEKLNCATNYYFDTKDKRCKMGKCQSEDSTTECRSPNLRRIGDSCSAFSVCEDGEYVNQSCTSGQYFSTKYASCQPITNSADHKCSCLLPPYAAISNPDDCETYYLCSEEGKAVLQQCPRGQYFNERVNSCLPDLNGICLKAPTMNSPELAMMETCSKFGNDVAVFKPTNECDKFLSCINGRMFTKRCPKGYYYDHITHFCQWDASGECAKQFAHTLENHFWESAVEKRETPNRTQQPTTKELNMYKRPQSKQKIMITVGKKVNAGEAKVINKKIENDENIALKKIDETALLDRDNEDNKKKDGEELMDIHKWNSVEQLAESSGSQAVSLYSQTNSLYNKLSSKFIKF